MDYEARTKHLLSDGEHASTSSTDDDQTKHGRSPGSNAWRVHGIYFAIVSIAALVLIVGLIAFASAAMN